MNLLKHSLSLLLTGVLCYGFLTATMVRGQELAMRIADLAGKWRLVSLGGVAVRTVPSIYFQLADGELSGYDGCNRFGGRIDPPGMIRATGRGCPGDQTMLPLDLARPMEQLRQLQRDGDRLILLLDDDSTAVFEVMSDD